MLDVNAIERLWSNPWVVVELAELPEYKRRHPREGEQIIDCYDVPRIVKDLIAELRASRKVVEKAAGVQRTAHPSRNKVYTAVVEQWWDALTVALAEYNRVINVRRESEGDDK